MSLITYLNPGIALGLGIANIAQWGYTKSLENSKARLIREKELDQARTDQIVSERNEIRDENKMLREDLRSEIERLKHDIIKYRDEAAGWQSKYEKELQANTLLVISEQNSQIKINSMEMQIKDQKEEIQQLRKRIDTLENREKIITNEINIT